MANHPSSARRQTLSWATFLIATFVAGLSFAKAGDNPDYYWNEVKAPGASYAYCTSDGECDGLRTCSPFGWCQGLARKTDEAHWGYERDAKGPKRWGDITEDYALCKLGEEQSPIDIQTQKNVKDTFPEIVFEYLNHSAVVVDNGHTIQVNLPQGGSNANFGPNKRFKLMQFHFHTPSEELVDGQTFEMVAHLVHQNDHLNYMVVAVLFIQGQENATLKPVFDAMIARAATPIAPGHANDPLATIPFLNPGGFLPADQKYYAYRGSLTTPPCGEGVSWYVLKQPVELSQAQIAAFRALYKMNARPVQPVGNRIIFELQ